MPLAFFSATAYGVFNFIQLARNWPVLMQQWEFVEAILPPYRSYEEKKMLGRTIRKVSWTVLSVALGNIVLLGEKKENSFLLFPFFFVYKWSIF